LADADLTIIALPARAWGEVLPHLKAKAIVSATKGLERDTSLTPLSFARQKHGYNDEALAVISGPSFASDLIAGRPISVVAGSKSSTLASLIANSLSSPSLRVYTSSDPIGVELGGILKNIIAIVAGVSDSLGYGPSARAAVISRGLYEMSSLAVALGAEEKTLTGLSGLGDLIMTATEDQSRNRTVGLRLGKGEQLADVIASLGATAEGVSSAPLVLDLAQQHGIAAPLTEHVVRLMNGEIRATEMAHALMTRPLKSEF
jgi:glycerol-3-phosphate dehydrogenase (NAD(P)+)